MLPVPLNSWKMNSSILEPVSTSAVAIMVREPPSSILRAEANILRGICRARTSTPPVMAQPAAAMHAVVGAGHAGDGIQQHKNVPSAFHHAAAAFNH